MLHAKVMVVDGNVSCIGSANFNTRSLALDEDLAGVLDRHFDEDWERSEEIDLARWRNRNALQRGMERATGLAAWFI